MKIHIQKSCITILLIFVFVEVAVAYPTFQFTQKLTIPSQSYLLLKCDFHVHTTASDGVYTPTEVVALYKSFGYDVIAITDHNTITGVAEAYYEGKKAGLTVIQGEEVSCIWANGEDKHVVSLFNSEQIGFGWENIPVKTIFNAVHAAGGIGIVAHPWYGWENWQLYQNAMYIDGWEVGTPSTEWTYTSGLIYLLNHDFHDDTSQLPKSWTYLLAKNNTVEGVKDALLAKRIVTYDYGKIKGSPSALALYEELIKYS